MCRLHILVLISRNTVYRSIIAHALLVILGYMEELQCHTISQFNGNKLLISL